jgi:hypothetical protein
VTGTSTNFLNLSSVSWIRALRNSIRFLILAPGDCVSAAFAIHLLQTLIAVTGGYAFFNLLTVTLCLFHDDALLQRRLPAA